MCYRIYWLYNCDSVFDGNLRGTQTEFVPVSKFREMFVIIFSSLRTVNM